MRNPALCTSAAIESAALNGTAGITTCQRPFTYAMSM